MQHPLNENVLCYGQAEPPPALLPLRAGPLHMEIDPTSGFLRTIRLGDREVLRGIYAAVRDANWGTVPAELTMTSQRIGSDSFRFEFECMHRRADIDFTWRGIVDGGPDGTVRYEFDGEARSSFRKARIGFCVLHPIRECAGARARQFRIDGSERETRFPVLIEPQIFGQGGFRDLRAIRHEIQPGSWAQVDFDGDVFEMEDQRNWTDASFKTYCTPLTRPFPVEVRAGDRVRQSVTLRLEGLPAQIHGEFRTRAALRETVLVIPEAPDARLPQLGLGIASHGEELAPGEIARLGRLRLGHLRVDVHLNAPDQVKTLQRALRQAAALDAALELALHLPEQDDGKSGELSAILRAAPVRLARVLALREKEIATTPRTIEAVHRYLSGLDVPVGAGSDCNFRELNYAHAVRELGLAGADFVFWSINPQVHARDHRSVMETLEAQGATVETARALAGRRPLVVTPLTLRPRFNPVATGAEPPTPAGELPPAVDPRQRSRFAAAWTLGSVAALAIAGVESATFYETTGWSGLMEREKGSPLPEKFPSNPGEIFPVYGIFEGLAGVRDAAVVNADELVAVAAFGPQDARRLVLGNLALRERRVRIEGWGSTREINLAPYEVLHLGSGSWLIPGDPGDDTK